MQILPGIAWFRNNKSSLKYASVVIFGSNHYYPFGMVMEGISCKSFLKTQNQYKFTGQSLNEDLGLLWYEFKYRMMDVQIGRFGQIDPLSSKYVHNSNYAYAENKVTFGIDLEGLELLPINSSWFKMVSEEKSYAKYGGMKIWNERIDVVANNVPAVFRDESGAPLFNASSVGLTNEGIANLDNKANLMPSNNLPSIPGWSWADTEPDPSNNIAGGYIGNNLEENRAFADRWSSKFNLLQEFGKYYDTYFNKMPIWKAHNLLNINQKTFDKAIKMVGENPGGFIKSETLRGDLINFINDGTMPSLNKNDLRSSLRYGLSVMKAGFQIMRENRIAIQTETLNTYAIYEKILEAFEIQGKRKGHD